MILKVPSNPSRFVILCIIPYEILLGFGAVKSFVLLYDLCLFSYLGLLLFLHYWFLLKNIGKGRSYCPFFSRLFYLFFMCKSNLFLD